MIDQIALWSWPRKVFLLLGIFMGILLLGFFADLVAELMRLGKARVENRQQQLLLHNEQELLMNKVDSQQSVNLPLSKSSLNISLLLNTLTQMAQENSLQVKSLQPARAAALQPILPINMLIVGDYQKISQFIADITTSTFPLVLIDFSITTLGGNSALQAKLKIEAYKLAVTYQKKSLPIYFVTNLRDPFQSSLADISLHSVPIQKLTMVGIISMDQRVIALVKLPNGSVEAVSTGDLLGQENGLVTTVTEKNILVRLSNAKNLLRIPLAQ